MTTHLPARFNISTYPDVNIRQVFKWLVDGEPKDLTDWMGRFRIGRDGVFLIEPADAVLLGGPGGTISLNVLPGTLTEAGTYWYVLDLLDDNDGVVRFVEGTLQCLAVYR